MGVAHVFWGNQPLDLTRRSLTFPFAIYFSNILFGVVLSLAAGIWIPVVLGIIFAVIPCSVLYWLTPTVSQAAKVTTEGQEQSSVSVAQLQGRGAQ